MSIPPLQTGLVRSVHPENLEPHAINAIRERCAMSWNFLRAGQPSANAVASLDALLVGLRNIAD